MIHQGHNQLFKTNNSKGLKNSGQSSREFLTEAFSLNGLKKGISQFKEEIMQAATHQFIQNKKIGSLNT